MEMTPEQLKSRLDAGESLTLLDCREPLEWQFNRIDGAVHIPMRETPARVDELPRDGAIVVYCHHGIRSLSVAAYLREEGFGEVWSLAGGIDAWSAEVDTALARY